METLQLVLQIVIALGIANVWLVRASMSTPFRGGGAGNLEAEFAAYGLSPAAMRLVGGIKLTLAALLLAGIWVPALVVPAAVGMVLMMAGALAMHVKVSDPAIRSAPAFAMLVMSGAVAALSLF